MKRTLAIALSSIALAASTSAFAQSLNGPQPSFVDYPLVEANLPVRAEAHRNDTQAWPQPSFIDYVAIEPGAVTGSGGTVVAEGLPQPSFIDYPAMDGGTRKQAARDTRAMRAAE